MRIDQIDNVKRIADEVRVIVVMLDRVKKGDVFINIGSDREYTQLSYYQVQSPTERQLIMDILDARIKVLHEDLISRGVKI